MCQPDWSGTDDPHQRKIFLKTYQFWCTPVVTVNCEEVQHSCQSAKNSRATLYNLIRSSACRTIFTLMMTTFRQFTSHVHVPLSTRKQICGFKEISASLASLICPSVYSVHFICNFSHYFFHFFFLDFIDCHGLLFRSRSANKENFLLISFGSNCSSHMLSERGSSDNTNKLPQTKNICNRAVGEA